MGGPSVTLTRRLGRSWYPEVTRSRQSSDLSLKLLPGHVEALLFANLHHNAFWGEVGASVQPERGIRLFRRLHRALKMQQFRSQW